MIWISRSDGATARLNGVGFFGNKSDLFPGARRCDCSDRCANKLTVATSKLGAFILLGALTFAGSASSGAQSRPAGTAAVSAPVAGTGLLVTGAVAHDLKLSLDDLKKMPRKSVSTRGHDDRMHQYDGVPIGALLAKAGVPQGSALKGKSMALTVVAEGFDGYRAVFSLTELDEDFAAETVLIVDSTDGQPLAPEQGPLRLVVPGDKRQGRWVRMLKSITVVNLGSNPPSN